MQLSSIANSPMIKRFRRVLRLFIRNRRLRSVERAMHRAWPETAKRVEREVPPTRAAYNRNRRNPDYWAGVYGGRPADDDGSGVLV